MELSILANSSGLQILSVKSLSIFFILVRLLVILLSLDNIVGKVFILSVVRRWFDDFMSFR